MSFRIDDILKNKVTVPKQENFHSTVSEASFGSQLNFEWCNKSTVNENQCSILQQTLQHKGNPCYLNEQYPMAKFYSNWFNCDKMYLPYNVNAHLLDKATSFPSLYNRRLWPMYSPVPMMLSLPYTHYSKRKGGQVRFTASQTDALEKRFHSHKYLSPEDRRILAESLKLTDRQVKTWFQNRRAKWRRCNSVSSNSTETRLDSPDENEPDSEIF